MSPKHERPTRARRGGGLAAAAAALALVVAACGGSGGPASAVPGSPAAPGSAAPSAAGPGSSLPAAPTFPLATPAVVDGVANQTDLVPPDLEEGDVPSPEPAAAPLTGSLDLGVAGELARATVGPDGGTIAVSKPGDPLDGLVIEVPAGTYTSDVAFTVASRAITSSTFGAGITPLGPLVSVDNGGAVATGAPVRVTIPATVPEGATVLGLYYHADGGTLDTLPVIEQTATSVTLAATHFSDIFAAILNLKVIPDTADSGFRPGVDDWQFTNYGSFVAPGGHCEGQVVSAMWYYLTQRLGGGASALYGLYDNNGGERTPTFWRDDSDGYRMASAVQADPIAIPSVYRFFSGFRGKGSGGLVYDMFRAAIAITGEPQLIAIADSAGGSGHAMIVYRVAGNRLYVADPNYPGRLRTIAYHPDTGVLGPYSSGANAGAIATGGAISYTQFALVPKTASAADSTVAAHWAELEAGTIGDAIFPGYSLEAWEGQDEDGNDIWVAIDPKKGYTTPEEKLRVRLVAAGGTQLNMTIYRGASTKPLAGWAVDQTVDLKKGANDLGFYVMGAKDGGWQYVDFARVTVTKGLIDINGSWTGTLTFNDIWISSEKSADAEKQGCDIAILDALRNTPLPMTLQMNADEDGTGDAVLVIDASSLSSDAEKTETESDPVEMTLVYRDGVITFDLGEQCGEASCAMTGTPYRKDNADMIDGKLSVSGDGYRAGAVWTVKRAEE